MQDQNEKGQLTIIVIASDAEQSTAYIKEFPFIVVQGSYEDDLINKLKSLLQQYAKYITKVSNEFNYRVENYKS